MTKTHADTTATIQVNRLSKSYGNHEVLHGITMDVPQGELVGFLGPNGAGKTTAIRILLGLISASSGGASIFGKPCAAQGPEIRREIGYLPGEPQFYPDLTGRATLEFLARARQRDCRQEIERLTDVFELDLNRAVRKYSSGMKQKLGLMQALMHRPKLLILDEPTNALDPLVRQTLFAELRAIANADRTVLFSSHTLSEVEELCDQVVILRDGHIVEQQSIANLRSRSLRHVSIQLASLALPAKRPAGLTVQDTQDGHVSATWSGNMSVLLDWLAGLQLQDVTIEPPDLEDLFMSYYAMDQRSAPSADGTES